MERLRSSREGKRDEIKNSEIIEEEDFNTTETCYGS